MGNEGEEQQNSILSDAREVARHQPQNVKKLTSAVSAKIDSNKTRSLEALLKLENSTPVGINHRTFERGKEREESSTAGPLAHLLGVHVLAQLVRLGLGALHLALALLLVLRERWEGEVRRK